MKTRLTFLAASAVLLLSVDAHAQSLIGWWKLDDVLGTTAKDSSGNGKNGEVKGDPEWEEGVMVGGLKFDGDGDWVDISDPSIYSTEDDFTWSVWIRCLDGQVCTDGGAIIAKCPDTGNYGNGSKCLYVAADGKLEFNINGSVTLSTDTDVNDGLWHHVALTVEFETSGSNDTAKLYIDGALPDDATKNDWNVNQHSESASLKFGFSNDFSNYFYGRMDDVRIYDYVLNDEEIADDLFGDSGYLRFVVVGDSRGNDTGVHSLILGEIANAIVAEKAEFVIFPGDLVNGYCDQTTLETQLTNWRNKMQPVYNASIDVYPVRGNHDVGDPAGVTAWNNVFSDDYALPNNGPTGEENLTYWVEHKNILIVGMDVYIETHKLNQNWLNGVLAGNTWRHVFVFTHEPAFGIDGDEAHDDGLYGDKGADPPIDYTYDRDLFWVSLEDEPGCRLYSCGHDHFYDHAWIYDSVTETEDVRQMIVGTAGAPLRIADRDGYFPANPWIPINIEYQGKEVGPYCYGYVVVEVWGVSNKDWGGRNVTAHWKRRINTENSNPSDYEPGGDVWSYTFGCLRSTSDEYDDWVKWGKPECWCYERQCRGDSDGLKIGPFWVQQLDLNALVAAFNKIDTVLATIPNGICSDYDHIKTGPFRVGMTDLNIFSDYFNKTEVNVPSCEDTVEVNFWTN